MCAVLSCDARSSDTEDGEGEPAVPSPPLRPLPLIEVPFERICMDLIGRMTSAKSVAQATQALFQVISQVWIPKEILTDQGTLFMAYTLRKL